jgi:hypothetical protein
MAKNDSRKMPVALQINNTGAWKTICRFDAAELVTACIVTESAARLGAIDATPPTFRVVTDDGLQQVRMRWSLADGWKAVQR